MGSGWKTLLCVEIPCFQRYDPPLFLRCNATTPSRSLKAIWRNISISLRAWADEAASDGRRRTRWERARAVFALDGQDWNDQRALDRYELLYEAGLVPEARSDHAASLNGGKALSALGQAMASDHRRILATAIARLRAKIRYRPVLFELMPERFTLRTLQDAAEAVTGLSLHPQNFRRALDKSGLVDSTGEMETRTGGRPAQLYRYRRDALLGQQALGVATPRLR
ncbi:MAG: hypothetical protein AAFW68_12005 [Pseudomonadota bacterium]